MTKFRTGILIGALVAGLAGPLAGDAATVGMIRQDAPPKHAAWTEVKWPFLVDQWGSGRAFQCDADDCGAEIGVYLRPKIGFCNCTTGVSDDAELDRVGDLELFSDRFKGLRDGRPVAVGWMNGRSRTYRVEPRYAPARTVLAIAFNDNCDVVVATVVTEGRNVTAAERAALDFLNGDTVLRWVGKELGL